MPNTLSELNNARLAFIEVPRDVGPSFTLNQDPSRPGVMGGR